MITKYTFPHEVIEDPSLGAEQKRALLSEWASDACAIPDFLTMRQLPGDSFSRYLVVNYGRVPSAGP
jgi:hypothetical protein